MVGRVGIRMDVDGRKRFGSLFVVTEEAAGGRCDVLVVLLEDFLLKEFINAITAHIIPMKTSISIFVLLP